MDPLDTRFADCLHYATHRRRTGEPFETAIFNTTIYALPGEPQGGYQYARWANPTWTALEEVLSLLLQVSQADSTGLRQLFQTLDTPLHHRLPFGQF